jgi:hypothetical protein
VSSQNIKEAVSKVTEAAFFYFQFFTPVYAQFYCIKRSIAQVVQYCFCGKIVYGKVQNIKGFLQGKPSTSGDAASS